jgi:hypothetical protein
MARYPEILAGNRITAQLLDSMLPDVVVKAANETVTSSTTLQNDDELFVSVEANAQYEVSLRLLHDSDNTAAADVKMSWTGPSGATMFWGGHGANVAESGASSGTITATNMETHLINETMTFGGGDSTGTYAILGGVLVTSSTAGTLQYQWAQNTSNAIASTVRAGSTLSVRRIA